MADFSYAYNITCQSSTLQTNSIVSFEEGVIGIMNRVKKNNEHFVIEKELNNCIKRYCT